MSQTGKDQQETKSLLDAYRLKLDHEYSLKDLFPIIFFLLLIGFITFGLSSSQVNQNEKFAWFTIIQGIILSIIYAGVKYYRINVFISFALVFYISTLLVELLFLGIPNNLLAAYTENNIIAAQKHFRFMSPIVGALIIGSIFPIVYLCFKLFVGWKIFTVYNKYRRYASLPKKVKDGIKKLK